MSHRTMLDNYTEKRSCECRKKRRIANNFITSSIVQRGIHIIVIVQGVPEKNYTFSTLNFRSLLDIYEHIRKTSFNSFLKLQQPCESVKKILRYCQNGILTFFATDELFAATLLQNSSAYVIT